jgi:hypothetical protein
MAIFNQQQGNSGNSNPPGPGADKGNSPPSGQGNGPQAPPAGEGQRNRDKPASSNSALILHFPESFYSPELKKSFKRGMYQCASKEEFEILKKNAVSPDLSKQKLSVR